MIELSDAQLREELKKCEYCEQKPCREACPAHCSPADFIMAAQVGERADIQRAAAEILTHNPLGGICGAVCPDFHCMKACVRTKFDQPVNIPNVQVTLIQKAIKMGSRPDIASPTELRTEKIAVIGAGPAGLAAAFTLLRFGYQVDIFEKSNQAGGACQLIPTHRLPSKVLQDDLDYILASDRLQLKLNFIVDDPKSLNEYAAVVLAVGLTEPVGLNLKNEEQAIYGWHYLTDPKAYPMKGAVAVIGGGAVACDCAVTARMQGAERVELFSLEKWSEMPLTFKERAELEHYGIQTNGRTRVKSIRTDGSKAIVGLDTIRVAYPTGDQIFHDDATLLPVFDPKNIRDIVGTDQSRNDIQHVVIAIGHRPSLANSEGLYAAGDCVGGPSSVVEAVASGKNAAQSIHASLTRTTFLPISSSKKSRLTIPGYAKIPVPLRTRFFNQEIMSPFLLSAAPPTDGYEQMARAFEAGWAGGIMKTAFDNIPIHIPSEYMFSFSKNTWANCDNVSGHSLSRVCEEAQRLLKNFPEHLVVASTGGPVSGNDDQDAKSWQANTKMLEQAGINGIEYSLSCPQGGDGTEGDIVSQNAALTAKIIGWILQTGDPNVPKLFKLTAAVTSVVTILNAVKETLNRFPKAYAGVTLANTFPSLGFRVGNKTTWEEGVVVGMSGAGVIPISNMTLAKVAGLGVTVSGNGGPMDYRAAADFLALGAETVQFCTIAMKYGYAIIDELNTGLSHLMQARGIASVSELIGRALPEPVTDFMDLSPVKKISDCSTELCVSCGNCTRCSYFAVALDEKLHPMTDPEKCIGCSICTKKCISGALFMRERTAAEQQALKED